MSLIINSIFSHVYCSDCFTNEVPNYCQKCKIKDLISYELTNKNIQTIIKNARQYYVITKALIESTSQALNHLNI